MSEIKGKTKEDFKTVLKLLLEVWEKGEGPISETAIAREINKRKEDLTDSNITAGKIYAIPKNQKNINNLFSKNGYKDYFALFTTNEGNKYNAKLHEITPNGIFWLFCEDGISFKRFLKDFSRIALDSLFRFYEQEYGWMEDKEMLENDKKTATGVIKKLNTFFENHPEKRTGALLKKYLRKYDLERYSFSDFELKTVIHNVLYIFGRITMEDYEESLLHDEGYVGIACDFVPERRGDNRLFIAVNNVFEIPESKP